jgi:hypothetical protein
VFDGSERAEAILYPSLPIVAAHHHIWADGDPFPYGAADPSPAARREVFEAWRRALVELARRGASMAEERYAQGPR